MYIDMFVVCLEQIRQSRKEYWVLYLNLSIYVHVYKICYETSIYGFGYGGIIFCRSTVNIACSIWLSIIFRGFPQQQRKRQQNDRHENRHKTFLQKQSEIYAYVCLYVCLAVFGCVHAFIQNNREYMDVCAWETTHGHK